MTSDADQLRYPDADGRRAILIADDNPMNLKVIRQQLRLLGLATDSADNGLTALQRWQSGTYAMLITDLVMPLMDGYALTAAIRAADNGKPRRPIIAFTADVPENEGRHCLASGMDDYLLKPVQLASLKAILARWLPLADAAPVGKTSVAFCSATAPSTTFDSHVLKGLIGTDEAMICDFLDEFRRGARPISAALRLACLAGQTALAGALAHQLKSSARSVGATTLARLCADLETAGKGADSASLLALLPLFEQASANVDAALEAYINGQEPSHDR